MQPSTTVTWLPTDSLVIQNKKQQFLHRFLFPSVAAPIADARVSLRVLQQATAAGARAAHLSAVHRAATQDRYYTMSLRY